MAFPPRDALQQIEARSLPRAQGESQHQGHRAGGARPGCSPAAEGGTGQVERQGRDHKQCGNPDGWASAPPSPAPPAWTKGLICAWERLEADPDRSDRCEARQPNAVGPARGEVLSGFQDGTGMIRSSDRFHANHSANLGGNRVWTKPEELYSGT